MADQKRLEEYIIKNSKKYDLQITSLTWPKNIGIDLFDIYMKVYIQGNAYEGRGTHSHSSIAICKAFVEALERNFVYLNKWRSSNGVAGHFDRTAAESSAKLELLERHVFFSFFYTGSRFPTTELMSPRENLVSKYLDKKNINCLQSTLKINEFSYFSLITLLGSKAEKKFGIILGTAASNSIEDSLEKALVEAFRFYIHYENNDYMPLSEEDFNKIENPQLEHHGRLGLNLHYGEWFEDTFFAGSQNIQNLNFNPKLNCQTWDLSETERDAPPLFFSRATSTQLLNLEKNSEMIIRAQEIFKEKFQTKKPHPFR